MQDAPRTIHTVVFDRLAGDGERLGITLSPEEVESTLDTRPRPCVVAIAEDELLQIKRIMSNAWIIDRGVKHPSRSLATCFSPKGDRMMICADHYSHPGQTKRGLTTLLSQARARGQNALFVVGLRPPLIGALWKDALPLDAAAPSAPSPDNHLRILIEKTNKLKIPASLCKAFLGDSADADWIRRLIVMAARSTHPVLVLGGSGTGKEIVARQIHHLSKLDGKCNGKFVAVNCAGIPDQLLESELFGHVKGAFTDATRTKKGLWADAEHGVLFLDEIGELSPTHQAKLLRVLQEQKFRPVGGIRSHPANARIITATNRDLVGLVKRGRFREDLFHRISDFRIRTQPLRSHPTDIPLLAKHFWAKTSSPWTLSSPMLRFLQLWPWPGNVRELRSFLNNLSDLSVETAPSVELARAVMEERTRQLEPDD